MPDIVYPPGTTFVLYLLDEQAHVWRAGPSRTCLVALTDVARRLHAEYGGWLILLTFAYGPDETIPEAMTSRSFFREWEKHFCLFDGNGLNSPPTNASLGIERGDAA